MSNVTIDHASPSRHSGVRKSEKCEAVSEDWECTLFKGHLLKGFKHLCACGYTWGETE